MKTYKNIAQVITKSRKASRLSQRKLAYLLGLKSDSGSQFISNCERGLCSLPFEMLIKISEVLEFPLEEYEKAIIEDTKEYFKNVIKKYNETKQQGVNDGQERTEN